ncbi:hypothetical protein [Mucilaginibacter glaciei]|uniref:Uncharacterized protein n=1 Tax=Mucilaginibacter glaciei TaxID=2772109 RepID=A0A926NZ68_9SPHI|nr:hypothetical protein [Mucilaginibacter glaciei]MBD1394618.1 hypothetical protein [Mucilaginibacter glaciei]
MEKKYTVWERITNDTPSFFKKAQVFGASLVVLSISLAENQLIPSHIITIIASIGGTIAAIAQFAVKQYEPYKNISNDNTK